MTNIVVAIAIGSIDIAIKMKKCDNSNSSKSNIYSNVKIMNHRKRNNTNIGSNKSSINNSINV